MVLVGRNAGAAWNRYSSKAVFSFLWTTSFAFSPS